MLYKTHHDACHFFLFCAGLLPECKTIIFALAAHHRATCWGGEGCLLSTHILRHPQYSKFPYIPCLCDETDSLGLWGYT